MQAHANDLRSEVQQAWVELTETALPATGIEAALDGFVHQVASDWRQCALRPAVGALLEYSEKVTRTPAECAPVDLARLREAGWSDASILDAVQVMAYFNYINRISDALGVEVEAQQPRWGTRAD